MTVPNDIDQSAPVIANHRITIEAPRDLVWKLHTDIDAWPTWQTTSAMPLAASRFGRARPSAGPPSA